MNIATLMNFSFRPRNGRETGIVNAWDESSMIKLDILNKSKLRCSAMVIASRRCTIDNCSYAAVIWHKLYTAVQTGLNAVLYKTVRRV